MRDFFSVLMFYGHMSKEDIKNSSRPFLYGIYRMYIKRACENLGVSDKQEDTVTESYTVSDYPVQFKKLSSKERQAASDEYKNDNNFLMSFSEFNSQKFNDILKE